MPAKEGTWRLLPSAGAWRALAVASSLAALALGIFLVARRASGGVFLPLSLALLIPTAAALVAWAWLVRSILTSEVDTQASRCRSPSPLWGGLGSGLSATYLPIFGRRSVTHLVSEIASNSRLPIVAILLFALALSYPGTRLVDWLVWLAGIAAALVGPPRVLAVGRRSSTSSKKQRGQQFLIQDLKRYRSAEGHESVRGTLAAEFTAGQRTAILYAGFCPPFEFLPHVTAHVTSEAPASVKVAQALHNGLQLEVRLPRAAATRQVVAVVLTASEPEPG